MTTGTGKLNFAGGKGTLTAVGDGAPSGARIISGQFVYGALGSCQGGTAKLAALPGFAARSARWQFKLTDADGEGNVFAGIVDQATQAPGELADVPLIAPHRQHAEGLGVPISAGTSGVRAYALNPPYVAPTERMIDAISRALDPYPTADYGIGPDLIGVYGLPDHAPYATYNIDARATKFRSLGYMIPDYVTDALFDPGDGWEKYTYSRYPGNFILRRTGQATADPAILTADFTPQVSFTKFTGSQAGIGESREYAAFFGTAPAGAATTGGSFSGTGRMPWTFSFTMPTNSTVQKYADLQIGASVYIASTVPQTQTFNWTVDGKAVQTTETSQDSGTVISFRLYALGNGNTGVPAIPLAEQQFSPQPGNFGTYAVKFDVPGWRDDLAGRVLNLEVTVSQTKGHKVTLTLNNATARLTRSYPNMNAVVMPAGWAAPYQIGPIYEFVLPGWHVPPLLITGLPGGASQMAAGCTVIWNRGEASTLVTTQAWPYAGQRRGQR